MKRSFIKKVIPLILVIMLILTTAACKNTEHEDPETENIIGENKYKESEIANPPEEGMVWPEDQYIPTFASPSENMDGYVIRKGQAKDETLAASALQGLLNKTKPRLLLLYQEAQEGYNTWPKTTFELNFEKYSSTKLVDLIAKYKSEIKGAVLYSDTQPAVTNLAFTAASLEDALPLSKSLYEKLNNAGVKLDVVEDFTEMFSDKSEIEVYQYLYDNYWEKCTKRIFMHLNPEEITFYIRDMAYAVGAACVWLDPRNTDESEMLSKFYQDMTPGKDIVMGWWQDEHSGLASAARYGIQILPSDFFENMTVYAGMNKTLDIPKIPEKPELENKVYVALFLTDGDNVQYNQHAMRVLWKNSSRGAVPINWTISPILSDAAPAMMNYYYTTATENDCFVSGPSGAGYSTLENWGSADAVSAFLQRSEKYFLRTGIRAVTAWSYLTDDIGNAFAQNTRTLFGASIQDWDGSSRYSIFGSRFAFSPNNPGYASNLDELFKYVGNELDNYDGSEPMFFSIQASAWDMNPKQMETLKKKFDDAYPGKVEFCRADHYFMLYNEANSLPYNLSLEKTTSFTASDESADPALLKDGSSSSGKSVSISNDGDRWVLADLGSVKEINRYVITFAGSMGKDKSQNIRSYKVEYSSDGTNWDLLHEIKENEASGCDYDINTIKTRYLRFTILQTGEGNIAEIGDIEIYGNDSLKIYESSTPDTNPKSAENAMVLDLPKASADPVIDGIAQGTEWENALTIEINPDNFIKNFSGFSLTAGTNNMSSGTGKFCYTDKGLYMFVEMQDSEVNFGNKNPGDALASDEYANSPLDRVKSYDCDSFQIVIDPLNRNNYGNIYSYKFGFTAASGPDNSGEAIWYESWRYKGMDDQAGIVVKGAINDAGYILEAFIPFSALQKCGEGTIAPKSGDMMGFGLLYADVTATGRLRNVITNYNAGQRSIENSADYLTFKFN